MAEKKTVEQYLAEVSYKDLANNYVPSEFSIRYMNFIKMVNAGKEDIQASPAMHYKMADSFVSKKHKIANLVFRGGAKALSLDTNIYTPDGLKTMGEIQVGDRLFDRNGNITTVTHKSNIFRNQCYKFVLEDGTEFIANEDHLHILQKITTGGKFKEVVMNTKELIKSGISFNRKVTDRNPTGKESKWFIPLISKPLQYPEQELLVDPYTLGVILGDGHITNDGQRIVSISGSKNDLEEILNNCQYSYNKLNQDKRTSDNWSTRLLGSGKDMIALFGQEYLDSRSKYIPYQYLIGSESQRYALLQGLMDTDGTIQTNNGHCSFTSVSYNLAYNIRYLVKSLGGYASVTEKQNEFGKFYSVNIHLWDRNPFKLKRKADLWTPNKKYKRGKRVAIKDVIKLDEVIESQCISVASDTESYIINNTTVTHNTSVFAEYLVLYLAIFNHLPNLGLCNVIMYVSDSMDNGGKSFRMNVQARYEHSKFLQEYIPEAKFTDDNLIFTNKEGKETYIRIFGAASGVRGFKRNGDRPVLAILDDLISNEIANSKLQLDKVKDTIYKDVDNALNPMRNKIILNGTPFNKADPVIEAIESGAWESNVYPVCSQFPCEPEEFDGAWGERFSYEFIKARYEDAVKLGKVKAFNQELMLRITSEEDRVILDEDISWFNTKDVLDNKKRYNFYITTDFATSTNRKADFTVIGVWAVDNKENRYLVDGKIGRNLMNDTFNTIFSFVNKYQPVSVGIEVTGQQGGFVSLLREEMVKRNIWFNIARGKGTNKEGIAVRTNKMDRFRLTEPFFKRKKIFLPENLKSTMLISEILDELATVTIDGIKAVHDDAIDMISQLDQMYIIYPDDFQSNIGKKEVSQDEEIDPYFNDNLGSNDYNSYSTYLA